MNDTYALITGASSGIGKALATELASRGFNVLLVSKPDEDIDVLSRYFESEYHVQSHYLELDLLSDHGPEKVHEWIQQHQFKISILINNAGIGGGGKFYKIPPEHYDQMIRINLIIPVILTRLLLPELKKHHKSFIMFTGSIIASLPMPYKTVYSSTKVFLKSFSRALRSELKPTAVSISIGLPGPTITNDRIKNDYEKKTRLIQKWGYASPESVAKKMIQGMLAEKFLIIPGGLYKMFFFATKFMPERLSYLLFGKTFSNIDSFHEKGILYSHNRQ